MKEEDLFFNLAVKKGYLQPHSIARANECRRRLALQSANFNLVDYLALRSRLQDDLALTPEQLADLTNSCRLARNFLDAPEAGGARGGFQHYQIQEELGRGGMGVVYRARDEKLGRIVALKLLLMGQGTGDTEVKRFLQEARATAALNHPHIVKVYEVGEDPQPYFTMEYIEGETLAALVRSGRLKTVQAAVALQKVADALHAAHKAGIIHRDVKPANIMLDAGMEPKVMDFGLAKISDNTLSKTGDVLGTPVYMSPEQANAGKVDARSDIYSLGATLYEAITARPPFQGDSVYKLISQITANDPIAPTALNPDIPKDLEAICLKCLEKDPGKRYPSAHLLAHDLKNFTERRPVLARPLTRVTLCTKWLSRNRKAVALVLGLSLAAWIGIAWFIISVNSAKNAAVIAGRKLEIAQQEITVARDLALAAEQRTLQEKKSVEAAYAAVETTQKKAMEELYRINIALADKYCDEDNIAMSAQLLASCPEEMRHWEWEWINAKGHEEAATIGHHKVNAFSCAFTPDGREIVTSGRQSIKIWDVDGRKLVKSIETPDELGVRFDIAPDGATVISAGELGRVSLRDIRTGEMVALLQTNTRPVCGCAFSPDGKTAISGGNDGVVYVWDVNGQRALATYKGHNRAVYCCDFSPDGKLVASGGDHQVHLWYQGNGKTHRILEEHRSGVSCCKFSHRGDRLVSAGEDNVLYVWDVNSGKVCVALKGHANDVNCCAFSPDDSRVVSGGSDNTLRIWDAASGRQLEVLTGHTDAVLSCRYAPNGNLIASTSRDGSVKIWDTRPRPTPVTIHTAIGRLNHCAFSPDGAAIFVAGNHNVGKQLDAETGAALHMYLGHLASVEKGAFTPDGSEVITISLDQTVRKWDARSGKKLGILMGQESLLPGHKSIITNCAVDPGGGRVAITTTGATLKILDLRTTRLELSVAESAMTIECCAFSPDGKTIAYVADDVVKVLDAETGEKKWKQKGHNQVNYTCVFSPDGKVLATAGRGREIVMWQAGDGRRLATYKGHLDTIYQCAFSPDGARLVSAGKDNTLMLWDTRTGKHLLTLKGHGDIVRSCAFSPDGDKIASASEDGTLKIWDIGR